ncbi:MAG: site-2 protease family protein [Victivallales bacterium]|nr:site-2 protease family protein [Victivallales bacterium]
MNIFISYLFEAPAYYFCWVLSVAFSICVHEYSHAATASYFGDNTARYNGYMTLNPLRVMGVTSMISLALFGIAWGAVPVNPWAYRRRHQPSLVSAAGPFSNLALSFAFGMLFRLLGNVPVPGINALLYLTGVACHANALLFVFNMLPIPMLDGWGVLEPFVPAMYKMSPQTRNNISMACIVLLWLTPASRIVTFLSSSIANSIL